MFVVFVRIVRFAFESISFNYLGPCLRPGLCLQNVNIFCFLSLNGTKVSPIYLPQLNNSFSFL